MTLHTESAPSQDAAVDKAQRAAVKAHGAQAPPADETIHTTANHPWLTTDRGWVQAGDLHAGEAVVTLDGGTSTVAWVRIVPGQADYYNLTVAQDHTYAVGTGQAVVHNCEPEGFQTRPEALDAAHEHAGFSMDQGKATAFRNDLNPDSTMPSEYPVRYWNQQAEGVEGAWNPDDPTRVEGPIGKQRIDEHPFGHRDFERPNRPMWHDYGHFHAIDADGNERLFWYGPNLYGA